MYRVDYDDDSVMNNLVGCKILSLFVDEHQHCLSFSTNKGFMTYVTKGDCCSETWFSDILGVSSLLDGTVKEVMKMSMKNYNVEDGRCRQDSDEAYGYKILTNKGYCDIIFRNSSNGYYGGNIERFTGKQHLPTGGEQIIDDWKAN